MDARLPVGEIPAQARRRFSKPKYRITDTDLGLQFPVVKSIIISRSSAPCGRPMSVRRGQAPKLRQWEMPTLNQYETFKKEYE